MRKYNILLILILSFHLLLLLNIQFTAWPEMLSYPYMLNNGFLIYKDFHHPYQPLLTFFLSNFYKLFGYKILALEIFTWSVILLNDVFVFLISKKLLGNKLTSLVPVLVYVFLQPVFEGNGLWFDIATVPFILISIYLTVRSPKLSKLSLFLSGFSLALSFLIKQQLILVLPAFFIYLWRKKVQLNKFLFFVFGGIFPVFTIVIYLSLTNILKEYFFWTLKFPLNYLPIIPGYVRLPNVRELIILITLFLVPIFLTSGKRVIGFLVLILIFSLLSAFPRLSYLHLQPALVITSFLIGDAFISGKKYILIVPIIIALVLWKQNLSFFGKPARFYDEEAFLMARKIVETTKPNDKVYLLGPHSIIYILSNRLPQKPWIENYVWYFEIPGMQESLISGFENDPPKIILWTEPKNGNWFDLGVYQPKKITNWIAVNYTKKGEVTEGVWLWEKI